MPDNAPPVIDLPQAAADAVFNTPEPTSQVAYEPGVNPNDAHGAETLPDGKVRHAVKPDIKDNISWDDFLPADEKVVKVVAEPKLETKPTESVVKQPSRAEILRQLGITEAEEVADFAEMSNNAFQRMKKTIQKQRELENRANNLEIEVKKPRTGDLPASYYEHPEAYQLHPEYTKVADTYQKAAQETQHWERQFSKIRKAEKWQDLEVDATGNLKLVEKEPDAESEIAVLGYIQNGRRLLQENSQKIEALKQTFKSRYDTTKSEIAAEEDKHFPAFKDPDYANKNQFYGVIKKALEERGLANDPLTGSFSKLYAVHMELRGKYSELLKQQEAKATVVTQQRQAGPAAGNFKAGATPQTAKDNDRVSWAEFEAVTNR